MQSSAFPLAFALPARAPVWRLTIEGKDVTRDVSPMVLSVTYTDHTHGKSDELQLQLDDSSGRWRNGWWPDEGDRMELFIGYAGEALLQCGAFTIDECELAGGPDVLTVRALAASPTKDIRTRRSVAYEGQTLRQIAEDVARRHAWTLVGTIGSERIGRVTQNREDDLAFLTRLAEAYGYVFSVRDDQLIFYSVQSLEQDAVTFKIDRASALEYRLKRKTHRTYKACEVRYHDPRRGELVKQTVNAPGIVTGDTYKLNERAEDGSQAQLKALAALRSLNSRGAAGSVKVQGEPRLAAGIKGELSGFGIFDGAYQIESTEHRISRSSGYETTAELKRVETATGGVDNPNNTPFAGFGGSGAFSGTGAGRSF